MQFESTNDIYPLFVSSLPRGRGRGSGFTLIEAVVAVSVFAIASTSIVGVFLSVQRLNQASASLQALQQNARFISEDISKIIRNGEIDYSKYGCGGTFGKVCQPSVSKLFLTDQQGVAITIDRNPSCFGPQKSCLRINRGAGGPAPMTGREVLVRAFQVYIWPATNPFPGGTEQPTATIYLDLESNVNSRDRIRAKFQFTLTTRQYPE